MSSPIIAPGPILLIDNENRQLYLFAVAPCCSGGVIYYKKASLDNANFPPGLGTPFIHKLSTDATNDQSDLDEAGTEQHDEPAGRGG